MFHPAFEFSSPVTGGCIISNSSGLSGAPPAPMNFSLKWFTICFRITGSISSQPPCEAVSWNTVNLSKFLMPFVSLLVRLWVEITALYLEYLEHCRQPPCEAVSWNMKGLATGIEKSRQPPCEAVSWNSLDDFAAQHNASQPPCEAVSWNKYSKSRSVQIFPSASLWGCELKFYGEVRTREKDRQPPCEAVSWNMKAFGLENAKKLSASLWGCELKWNT